MIDDKRLRDVKKWLEKCDSPYEMEYAYYALEALEELQTLQKEIYFRDRVESIGEYSIGLNVEMAKKNKLLRRQNKTLIEDSEYWFSLADKYAIRNIPAVIERAKQHNALMQESEKIIK